MKALKKILGLTLLSTLVCTFFIGSATLAAPLGIMPRVTAQEDGSYSHLEATCTSQIVAIKYTNQANRQCFAEAVGYIYDRNGTEFNESLFCSGNIVSNASISDSLQKGDVYQLKVYANLYNGPSAGYQRIDHVEIKLER